MMSMRNVSNDVKYIKVCSASVEGTLENVKSDFIIPIPPINLSRDTWYLFLDWMSFDSSIVNYVGRDDGPNAPAAAASGKRPSELEASYGARKKRQKAVTSDPMTVQCQYALMGASLVAICKIE